MVSAPNPALGELASVIGDDAAREIVRLFLEDFPCSVERLTGGGSEEQQRVAHGLKSSALHMGAKALSVRMAEIETALGMPGGSLSAGQIAAAVADFEAVAPELRRYAGG
jgi:HPt (histidine-containing phosphotransfer) domain-containing protein